jgi:hypothetical protein
VVRISILVISMRFMIVYFSNEDVILRMCTLIKGLYKTNIRLIR